MEKIRIGLFGLWRGGAFAEIITKDFPDRAEVTAVLEKDETRVKEALEKLPAGVKVCRDFDELLDSGIDAVMLFNYFHEHADYAMRAMEKGVHVYSECTSAVTMKGCVELCETVERTGCKYMLGENYPFTKDRLEMEKLVQEGHLGRVLYAEGEYNHGGSREELQYLTPGPLHWRAWMPRTYYLTHSLGPLMYITKQMPKRVSGVAVHSYVLEEYDEFRHNYDALAMMNVITDDGALFRVSGCTAMASGCGYRVCGERAGVESGRTLGSQVNLFYQHWLVPEGKTFSETYEPEWPEQFAHAEGHGHGGSDYITLYNFLDYLQKDIAPFFDVYRGCAMSAVAILGWRSCLDDGKYYDVPDFTNKSEREAWRGDDLTPFPDENGNRTLPCATREPWPRT